MITRKYRLVAAGLTAMATAIGVSTLAFAGSASAAPPAHSVTGTIIHRIYAPDVYKPHETVQGNGFWISSNELGTSRGVGKGGITIFNSINNKVIAKRFVDGRRVPVYQRGGGLLYARGGTENHPFHPHGIALSQYGNFAYQVMEHSGYRWNTNRSKIVKARTTDTESGLLVVWNIKNLAKPTLVGSFLTGHAPHEAAVDPTTGWVYVGNHEDSPLTNVHNWVSVFKPHSRRYGFIDTGAWQALQGIWYDQHDKQIKAISHVGERMFAFKGGVWPTRNKGAAFTGQKRVGANTIAYSVGLRRSFVNTYPKLSKGILHLPVKRAPVNFKSAEGMPMVLHFHDLTVNEQTGVAYAVVHSVHHAEHTGSAAEYKLNRLFPPPPESANSEEVETEHFMGRWMAVITPARKISWVDMSNGYGAGKYPNAETVMQKSGVKGAAAVDVLENSFVHGHFLDVAPDGTVVVSGEHTGNVGLVQGGKLVKVIPVSQLRSGAKPDKTTGFFDEPHLHGVNIDQRTGRIYVADEGEHGYLASVTIMK